MAWARLWRSARPEDHIRPRASNPRPGRQRRAAGGSGPLSVWCGERPGAALATAAAARTRIRRGLLHDRPFEPGWPILLGVALPAGFVWLILRRRGGGWLALMFSLVACAGLGAIAGKARTASIAAPVLRQEIGPVRIEGVIAEIDASERSRRISIRTPGNRRPHAP
jgi:hypothetical protein